MPKKAVMKPDDVAQAAERQLLDLKQVQNKKMQEVMKQREDIVINTRTIQALAYAVGNTYKEVFPGAEGFIELRIKTPDSIATKVRNKITEILNEMQLDSNTDPKEVAKRMPKEEFKEEPKDEILKKIGRVDLKDIMAFTVVTVKPPKKFRTGSDELNKKLEDLASELEKTDSRIEEHRQFMDINERKIRILSNEINALKTKLASSLSEDEKEEMIKELETKASNSDNPNEIIELIKQIRSIDCQPKKENIAKSLNDKTSEYRLKTENVIYGEKNLDRTKEVYMDILRKMQYEMSSYFVSNLSKFSTFKFWGTKVIRDVKLIEKPGFRAVNVGYTTTFAKDNGQFKLKFEAQGKGKLDYDDAEFTALGAIYHEEQKTKDGLISKKTDMPDFTLIGEEETKKIEKHVRRKYQEITSLEDFNDALSNDKLKEEYKKLKIYEEEISNEIKEELGDNYLSQNEVKKRMNDAFLTAREALIQNEIEEKINREIDKYADSDKAKANIQENEELCKVYNEEIEKIKSRQNNNLENPDIKILSQEEIEHLARVRVMYYIKEQQILEYAKNTIPKFFRANISSNPQDEVMVYTFTVGESIYRYFYNKLNGLKDENGKYTFEPQEQQKRALLKLTGLFEEDDSNFYTYNRKTSKFCGVENMYDER